MVNFETQFVIDKIHLQSDFNFSSFNLDLCEKNIVIVTNLEIKIEN